MFADWEKEYNIILSPSISFTGGKPFLYEGLWDVLNHARRRENYQGQCRKCSLWP